MNIIYWLSFILIAILIFIFATYIFSIVAHFAVEYYGQTDRGQSFVRWEQRCDFIRWKLFEFIAYLLIILAAVVLLTAIAIG